MIFHITIFREDLHKSPNPERLAVHSVSVDSRDDLLCPLLSSTNNTRDPPGRKVSPLVLFQAERAHGSTLFGQNVGNEGANDYDKQ